MKNLEVQFAIWGQLDIPDAAAGAKGLVGNVVNRMGQENGVCKMLLGLVGVGGVARATGWLRSSPLGRAHACRPAARGRADETPASHSTGFASRVAR